MTPRIWDAVVIGAGPAGAVTALRLAQKKIKVLLVEKAQFPRDKVCGCCLSERTLNLFRQAGLGDLEKNLPSPVLSELHVGYAGKKMKLQIPPGRALSRFFLDEQIVLEAQRAGAEFWARTRAVIGDARSEFREVRLCREGREEKLLARVVVAACGLSGSSLTEVKHAAKISEQGRFGASAIFEDTSSFYQPGVIFMACGDSGYAGAVRLEDGRLNIAAALSPSRFLTEEPRSLSEKVSQLFKDAGFPVPQRMGAAVWSGTPALTRKRKILGGERYFIAGDAAGYSEPFTGEGMGWAVESALYLGELAAESLQGWKPEHLALWQAWHRRHIGARQRVSRLLAWGLKNKFILKWGFELLQRCPQIARPVIEAAAGKNFHDPAFTN